MLLICCRQAAQFARDFRRARPDVLKEELDKLHAACPGKIYVHAANKFCDCECDCHKKGEEDGSSKA